MTVLVAYGTKHGSTQEVAKGIAATLGAEGCEVTLRAANQVEDIDAYDAVVVGGSLYTGRWHPDARRFVSRHQSELARRPLAVFAMGPRTMADDDAAASRKQLDHALADFPELEPVAREIFGGVVDPRKLHFPLNHLPASDARDWSAIRAWATEVAGLIGARG
jgi:menaquinone-dependent protoporphyrinogen oxidase